jgi:sulfatase modifying factor 1
MADDDTTSGEAGIGGASGASGASGGAAVGGTDEAGRGGAGGEGAALGSGVCGDGIVEDGERCDDRNPRPGDGCSADCRVESGWRCDGSEPTVCDEVCGDGNVVGAEARAGGCDDGNEDDGDGCSASCTVEGGFFCSRAPSVCTDTCGNGEIDGDEECDDRNGDAGDGCFACAEELDWDCTNEPSLCTTVNDCEGDPCENGGVCVDGNGSYSCRCDGTGFEGPSCETNVDDCSPDPCLHGGLCSDLVSDYACDCTGTGYYGATCELDAVPCSPNPCQNGGACVEGSGSIMCDCTGTGYAGSTCQTDLNECMLNADNCDVNATCTNTPAGSFTCACNDGYSGDGITCTVVGASCSGMSGTECQGGSCCESPLVMGGTFQQGEPDAFASTVSSFRLDKYEVTVARFRSFVTAYNAWRGAGNPASGAGANPNVSGSGWNTDFTNSLPANDTALKSNLQCNATYQTWADTGRDTLPINCVDWYTSFAFCIWDGGRLPTEAEREYAAAGGANDTLYPWGNGPIPDNTLSTANLAVYFCMGDNSAPGSCAFSDILPVGSKPAGEGLYRQRDLAGSVWEWTLDWYAAYPSVARDNYAKLDTGSLRVVRGGNWIDVATPLPAADRNNSAPTGRDSNLGFRCARGAP